MKTLKPLTFAKIITVLVIATLLIGSVSMLCAVAFADGNSSYTVEQYTNSDYLLLDNGTESTNMTIQTFAESLKNAPTGTNADDITMVIPAAYLETDANQDFYYCGKEYGFFLSKKNDIYDLLLIDFVFEFDGEQTPENQYKIQIKPILQTSLKRTGTAGNYSWETVYTGYAYYVANPAFATSLLNENALNYGDAGYNKQTDEGLIIQQSYLNYGVVQYRTEGDLVSDVYELVSTLYADIKVDVAFAVADYFALGIPSAIKTRLEYMHAIGSGIWQIVKDGGDVTIKSNINNLLLTEQSKTSQKLNDDLPAYSRTILADIQGETILSDDGSYMELIVLLNDTNYRSRLFQVCNFEIVKKNLMYDTPEYVEEMNSDGEYEKLVLSFNKQRILFDDFQITPEFEEDCFAAEGSGVSSYLLPQGNQTTTFTPEYSGEYSFVFPSNISATVDGSALSSGESVFLTGGEEHLLLLTNPDEENSFMFEVDCELQSSIDWGTDSLVVPAQQKVIYSFLPLSTGHYFLEFNNSNIQLLNTTEIEDDTYYLHVEDGQLLYLVLENTATIPENVTVTTYEPPEIEAIDILPSGYSVYSFTNEHEETLTFELNIENWQAGYILHIVNIENESIGTQVVGQNTTFFVQLAHNETCFIKSSMPTQVNCTIGISNDQLKWKINGQYLATNSVSLARGETHAISLVVVLSDGTEINSGTAFVPAPTSENFSLSSSQIEIEFGYSIGSKLYIYPVYAPQYLLTVTIIKGKEGTITFDKQGGNGGTSSVYAYYGNLFPSAYAPIKLGYDFKGYFSEPEGEGIQYYDESMMPVATSNFVNNGTIYAHWEAVYYTVTFAYWSNGISKQFQVLKDHALPFGEDEGYSYAPKNEGYAFAGYYSQPNGLGTKYYEMQVLSDSQAANIYGTDYYYVEMMVPIEGINVTRNLTLYAYWEPLTCQYLIPCYDQATSDRIGTISTTISYNGPCIINQSDINIEGYSFNYYMVDFEQLNSLSGETFILRRSTADGEIVPTKVIGAFYTKACVAAGSLITLADGTQVAVENLTGDEMLLVWNLSTGTFDAAPILFIDSDSEQMYEVVHLTFSDGTVVNVISEHAFWDIDLNKYVYLRKDAQQYIGHWFSKQTADENGNLISTSVKLVNVGVTMEYTSAWSPVTYGHLCYYVNGMLSMPGGITGLFNIFEVDSETMMYDAEQMAADISQYGLFTYEEFAEIIPVSQEVFDAFNAKYFKVAIGKGLIDMEGIAKLAADYAEFF